jgi:starch-binding outer membrane protein SusE/F
MNTINNRKIFRAIALLAMVFGLVTGCDDKEGFEDVNVSAVSQFYEPVNSKYVVLRPSGSMYFEWEKAHADDNSIVYYDVLFDKEGGDFSTPLYTLASDNGGVSAGATITHKQINRIAGKAGIAFAEEGSLKWTVRSNRGRHFVMAEESRTLTVKRIDSVDELEGAPLLITGAGAEDGHEAKLIDAENNVYQMYTRLEAGKPFYFHAPLGQTERTFSIFDGVSFKETDQVPEGSTVSETSIYRITMDFGAAAAKIEKVSMLELVVSWSQRRSELTYVGKGKWELKDYNVQLTATSWGFDERYKFVFTIDGVAEHWGQLGPFSDPRPAISQAAYRYMNVTGPPDQWGGWHFKFPNELSDGADLDRYTTDIVVYMNTTKPKYTHEFLNIRG